MGPPSILHHHVAEKSYCISRAPKTPELSKSRACKGGYDSCFIVERGYASCPVTPLHQGADPAVLKK